MTTGPGQDRLQRWYRRLMWAYPRWYRRDRGVELLTTLLDDAAPGQRRPRRADAVDLVVSGLRTRLRPPGRFAGHIVAAFVAMYAGLAGAAVGVQLSDYPGPPGTDQAIAVARDAFGHQPRDVPSAVVACDLDCPDWDGRDEVVAFDGPADRTDRVAVWSPVPDGTGPARIAEALDRLAADGWRVDAGADTATLDGLQLRLSSGPPSPAGAAVLLLVSKAGSPATVVVMVAGFLLGALAGWPTAAGVMHAGRVARPSIRALMGLTALPAVGVAALTVLMTGQFVAAMGASAGFTPKDVQIPLFVLTVMPGVTLVAAGSAALTLALGLLPGAATARRRPVAG